MKSGHSPVGTRTLRAQPCRGGSDHAKSLGLCLFAVTVYRGGIGAWSLVCGCQNITVGGARVTQDEGAAEGLDLAVARAGSEIGFHALDEFTAADRQARTLLGHAGV